MLAEAVANGLNKMYEHPVSVPTRNIPARPNEDFDLLIGEVLVRFLEKTDIVKQIRHIDIENKMESGSFFLSQEVREKIASALKHEKDTTETHQGLENA